MKEILIILLLFSSCTVDNSGFTENIINPRIVSKGEILFRHHCSNCHHINLRKDLTASPLGKISNFRDSIYLIRSVTNFMELVQEGNDIANCQYDKFNRNVMPPFGFLSNENILDILNFIKTESINQKITTNEMDSILNCNSKTIYRKNQEIISEIEYEINSIYKDIFKDFKILQYPDFSKSKAWKEDKFSLNIISKEDKVIKVFEINRNTKTLRPLYYHDDKYTYNTPLSKGREIRIRDLSKYDFVAIEESSNPKLNFGMIKINAREMNLASIIKMNYVERDEIIKQIKK